MRVLIQDFAEDEGRFLAELQDAFPDVEFAAAESEEDQKTAIKDADVFYGFLTPEVYAAADTLKWIQVAGAGIDGLIKLPGLVDNEIVVTNTKGPHADAMADHVIGMMINMAHRWMDHFDDQRAHRWEGRKYLDMQIEITGSTMGIFGLGDVGKAVARRAQGFGIDVYAVDKFPKPNEEVRETWGLERLDDLLERSDWFVAAAPSTVETRGAIDARRLGLLKEGGHVIVISRGGIVDETALLDGLRSGRVAGAGLDVFAEEPLPEDDPLWDMPNVVITPHCSGVTTSVIRSVEQVFKENLRLYLAGEPFLYVCDKKAGF